MFEDSLFRWLSDACIAGAVLGCAYTLLGVVLTLRFGKRSSGARAVPEPVTLVKPLCGAEPGLAGRLASFCEQNYAAPIQLVFGAQDRADKAIGVVAALKVAYPAEAIDIKVDGRAHGSNRKVSNLVNMAPLMRHDVLVLSDSDIEVGPDYVDKVVGTLQRPGVGAVTCVYHGVPGAAGLWSRVGALSTNAQFLPNAIIAMSCGLATPCFGATIALRRETLERVGGFSALADTLADDYALGEAVRVLGHEVAVAPGSVGHVCIHDSAVDFFLHQIRSARTIRSIDPVGYIGLAVTNPLPFAILGLVTGAAGGLAAVVAAVISRALLCFAVERAFNLPRQPHWLLPLRDLIDFAIYIAGFAGGRVSWKGHRYRVAADGTLIQDSR